MYTAGGFPVQREQQQGGRGAERDGLAGQDRAAAVGLLPRADAGEDRAGHDVLRTSRPPVGRGERDFPVLPTKLYIYFMVNMA